MVRRQVMASGKRWHWTRDKADEQNEHRHNCLPLSCLTVSTDACRHLVCWLRSTRRGKAGIWAWLRNQGSASRIHQSVWRAEWQELCCDLGGDSCHSVMNTARMAGSDIGGRWAVGEVETKAEKTWQVQKLEEFLVSGEEKLGASPAGPSALVSWQSCGVK